MAIAPGQLGAHHETAIVLLVLPLLIGGKLEQLLPVCCIQVPFELEWDLMYKKIRICKILMLVRD